MYIYVNMKHKRLLRRKAMRTEVDTLRGAWLLARTGRVQVRAPPKKRLRSIRAEPRETKANALDYIGVSMPWPLGVFMPSQLPLATYFQ